MALTPENSRHHLLLQKIDDLSTKCQQYGRERERAKGFRARAKKARADRISRLLAAQIRDVRSEIATIILGDKE